MIINEHSRWKETTLIYRLKFNILIDFLNRMLLWTRQICSCWKCTIGDLKLLVTLNNLHFRTLGAEGKVLRALWPLERSAVVAWVLFSGYLIFINNFSFSIHNKMKTLWNLPFLHNFLRVLIDLHLAYDGQNHHKIRTSLIPSFCIFIEVVLAENHAQISLSLNLWHHRLFERPKYFSWHIFGAKFECLNISEVEAMWGLIPYDQLYCCLFVKW